MAEWNVPVFSSLHRRNRHPPDELRANFERDGKFRGLQSVGIKGDFNLSGFVSGADDGLEHAAPEAL